MRRRPAALLAAFVMVAVSACNAQQDISTRRDAGGPAVAPEFASHLVAPRATSPPATFDLVAHRGKPVVIDFWGSWCGPCRIEQPELNHLAQTYQSRGVTFIGVAMRDDVASVTAYLNDLAVPYPTVMDTDQSIAADYDIASPPVVIVVDGNGNVVSRYLGTIVGASDQLDQLLR